AERDRGLETARELVLSARAGLEQLEPARDGVFDLVIKTDVEMQKGALFARAPVATVKRAAAEQVERPSERPARAGALGDHDVQTIGHGRADLLEEVSIQVLASPEVLVHRRGIKLEHVVYDFAGEVA